MLLIINVILLLRNLLCPWFHWQQIYSQDDFSIFYSLIPQWCYTTTEAKKPQIFRVYCIKFSHLFSKLNTLGLWISLCKLWLWCTLYTAHTHITPTYIHDTYLWNVFGLSVCNLCLRRHILFLSSTCCSITSLLQQAVTKYIVTSCARVLAYTCLKHGAVSQDTWLHFFCWFSELFPFFFSFTGRFQIRWTWSFQTLFCRIGFHVTAFKNTLRVEERTSPGVLNPNCTFESPRDL